MGEAELKATLMERLAPNLRQDSALRIHGRTMSSNKKFRDKYREKVIRRADDGNPHLEGNESSRCQCGLTSAPEKFVWSSRRW
ncbi:hypothetical protein AVEN_14012-1 [Araneus ventricosus]|uniref:Uncharacterized protein n=1 Tax=Araneus ventricosus TaxID=182803 RepID=A0A4Y2WZG9_ARAVE|nr:hypothetical protein AVEN_261458-1 [Araneus ventricosus]GBO41182.1 hypothetical protein AVEN_14012-1 [Araneus ventricosus]